MTEKNLNPLGEPAPALSSQEVALNSFIEKWPDIEVLLERSGQSQALVGELRAYINDLRTDLSKTRFWRILMTFFTINFIIFSNALLVCILFYHRYFLFLLGHYGVATLIIAVFSSSVLLISKILGGLFRTHGDRNKDEILPPHLTAIMESLKFIQDSKS